MRKFAVFMSILGIVVLLGTCAIMVLGQRGVIEIDREHIASVVYCSLGIALECFVPSKWVVYQESITMDEEGASKKAYSAVILNIAAGIIMIILAVVKYLKK